MTRIALFALSTALAAAPAFAAPETYTLDTSHSDIVASYNHLGYSTTTMLFSGITGEIQFDQEDPAASSVTLSFPIASMMTADKGRYDHFMTPEFFGAADNPNGTFTSTSIEVTGETTANITGDLTLNGITKPVVLAATMNTVGEHPMMKKPWAGFSATTTVLRSEFDMGMFTPFVSDEVLVEISVEAMKAE